MTESQQESQAHFHSKEKEEITHLSSPAFYTSCFQTYHTRLKLKRFEGGSESEACLHLGIGGCSNRKRRVWHTVSASCLLTLLTLPLSRQTDTQQLLKLFPSGAQAASVSLSISALRLPDFYFYPLFRRDGGSRQTERRVHKEDKRRRQLMGDTVLKLKSTFSRRDISWILTAKLQVLMLIHLDGYEAKENHPLRCFFSVFGF